MAKKIKAIVKLQIPAGNATPAPPVGPALGQHGANIPEFCRIFNERTKNEEAGMLIPVVITIYIDRSFDFIMKAPPVSVLLKRVVGVAKASQQAGKNIIGEVSKQQLHEIATRKLADLNTADLNSAEKIVEGTARSMGIRIKK